MVGSRGNLQVDSSTSSGRRVDVQESAESLGTVLHVAQSVAVSVIILPIEAAAVIAHSQPQVTALDTQLDVDLGAVRVTNDVVQHLFEDQEDFPTDLCTDPRVIVSVRMHEAEADVARPEQVACQPAHALHEM